MNDLAPVRVRARVDLLPTELGGRSRALIGGTSYRPNHNFFGPDGRVMAIGLIDLPEGVELRPGASREVQIDLFLWPQLREEVRPGRQWRIQEGRQLVGHGTVLEILG